MNIDISNIGYENYCYVIHLATLQNIVTYKNDVYKIADILFKREPFEVIDFWRNISLGAEVLLKACFLKHHIAFFKKEQTINMVKK